MTDPADPEKVEPAAVGEGKRPPLQSGPAGGRSTFNLITLAHGLKMAALLLFLLPWVTVSCAEQTLVSLSGMDLATGSVTVTNPMTGEEASPAGSDDADVPVLIAALLIGATLIIGFAVRRALASLISIAGLMVATALISYSVLYRLPDRAREGATADSAQGISEAQIAELIRVDIAVGFWLTLAALLGAIAASLLAYRQAQHHRP